MGPESSNPRGVPRKQAQLPPPPYPALRRGASRRKEVGVRGKIYSVSPTVTLVLKSSWGHLSKSLMEIAGCGCLQEAAIVLLV